MKRRQPPGEVLEPRYLYRITWHDQSTAERNTYAGGVTDAAGARRLAATAIPRLHRVRGHLVIDRVRRVGPDTPAVRDRLALERFG